MSDTVFKGVMGTNPWKRYKMIAIILALSGIFPVAVLLFLGTSVFSDDPDMAKLFPIVAGVLLVTELALAGVFWSLDKKQRHVRVSKDLMVHISAHGHHSPMTEPLARYTRIELRQLGRTQSWYFHALHPDPAKSFSSAPFVGKTRAEIERDRIAEALGGITIKEAEQT